MSGKRSWHAGFAAEDQVALRYERAGYTAAARRWRGGGAEIDLIFRKGPLVVFVEVKQAARHDIAAERLRPAQMRRIEAAASAFLAGEPAGQDSEVRLDLALVDGTGGIEVIENAFGQ